MKFFHRASKNQRPPYRIIVRSMQCRTVNVLAETEDEAISMALGLPNWRFRKVDQDWAIVGIRPLDAESPARYFDPIRHSPHNHEDQQ